MYPTDPALDYVEEPTHDVRRPPNTLWDLVQKDQ